MADESLTTAVTIAVRSGSSGLEKSTSVRPPGVADQSDELHRSTPEGLAAFDKIGDLLYDKETGLPLMIVDSSAFVAILKQESDWGDFRERWTRPEVHISAAHILSISIVIDQSRHPSNESAD